jgi:hypothetical protein
MKTSHSAAVKAALLAICVIVPTSAGAQTTSAIPLMPLGELSAFPTIVQTGTKPTLTWAILHPSAITGGSGGTGGTAGGSLGVPLVAISPPGTLIPNQTLYVTVQPVGTGVTTCNSNLVSTSLPAEARVSVNGSTFTQLFYGTQLNVNPSKKLFIKKVLANQKIDFGGRYVINNTWSPFYTTRSANLQVVAMANGDTPLTTFPLHQSSQLAAYLRPYLDGAGRIKIGPMSVLIMMEIGATSRSLPCFDYQDMLLLVTFSLKHPNNGHGNNLDGVDSSNPGQGSGGPTGLNNSGQDPSGGVDDEIR